MSSAKRNLDNVIDGPPSPVITFRANRKTIEILEEVHVAGGNKSEFIRNAVLEHYETIISGDKK